MSKIKKYNAFISYRHSELDSEVAKGLQKALEHFRMLNADLEIIARVRYYYGYDDDGESLVLYSLRNDNKYDLYKIDVLDYEDLIEEADRLLDGYESSDAIKERYKMLD